MENNNRLTEIAVTTYTSNTAPLSKVAGRGFMSRLSSLWGWRPINRNKATTAFERKTGMSSVQVQTGNPSQRSEEASIGNIFKNLPLSEKTTYGILKSPDSS